MLNIEYRIKKVFSFLIFLHSTFYILHSAPLWGASLQSHGHGARQVGLGEAVTAGGAQGAYGIYYNPAQLALASNPEISMDYAKLLIGLSDNSNLEESYLGFLYPWKKMRKPSQAVGFARSYFSLESDIYDRSIKLFSEEVLYGSYGRSLSRFILGGSLQAGLTLKHIKRSFGDVRTNANAMDNTGKATNMADPVLAHGREKKVMSFDAGWNWRHPRGWMLGLAAADITEPDLALDPGVPDKLRRSYHVGTAYQASPYLIFVGNLELKNRLESVQDQRLAIGAERTIPTAQFGSFGFRGAFGADLVNRERKWRSVAVGVSWKSNALGIDYGFQMPLGTIESIGGNHRISLTVRFGETPPEEEIMELYRKERKARERLEKEMEMVVGDFERLLKASEARQAVQAVEVAKTTEPVKTAEVVKAVKAAEAVAAARAGEDEFYLAWKLYQERKKAGAPRTELIGILRHMLDRYSGRKEVAAEWRRIQEEVAGERRDFEHIWMSYQRLAGMNAGREILTQALQRIVKRFEGSGVDITEVYREIDRVKSK
ncbi:MAG: conjugal transfer protein TraF [Elusimicrobia bacterium]|nr:conjugal transfer protein TraF [Elusimicrobiota bacterium]